MKFFNDFFAIKLFFILIFFPEKLFFGQRKTILKSQNLNSSQN